MTAALKGAIRNFGLTAALTIGAVLMAPSSAAAQVDCTTATPGGCYTLTFDNPEPTGSVTTEIASPYGYTAIAGKITITDGFASSFGATTLSDDSCGNGNHADLCYVTGTATGTAAAINFNNSNTGIGEFIFTPAAGAPGHPFQTDFISVVLGNSSGSSQTAVLRLYDLTGTTLLATYSSTVAAGAASSVALASFVPVSGTIPQLEANIAAGYRFEWGATTAAGAGGDNLYVDNLIFKAEIAPEPNTMLLLGTGLLGLAPLARRRRKKA